MLARSGSLPVRGPWAYEVKWDGFRAIVRTGDDYRVRSRRGWDMTDLVPELETLPEAVYDGELVAFDGRIPYFPDVCSRLLNGDRTIQLIYMVFDVLAVDGRRTMALPYLERRRLLEQVDLPSDLAVVSDWFDDGAALWEVVCERGLEGVVAKRLDGRYVPGERGWVKTKNRETVVAARAGARRHDRGPTLDAVLPGEPRERRGSRRDELRRPELEAGGHDPARRGEPPRGRGRVVRRGRRDRGDADGRGRVVWRVRDRARVGP